jgi:ERCC4-type nuclease
LVLIDDRGGATAKQATAHYPTLLASLIPNSILTRLDAADVAFSGAGGISIGIELKKVSDALSCLYTGRLADDQLPAMAEAYNIRYLVIEELYRAEPETGVLQRYRGELGKWGSWYDAHAGRNRTMYATFEMWLHTLSEQGGARLERTADIYATASLIQALYRWWQRDDHQSMNVMHLMEGDAAALTRPTLLRRIAAQLPGIGWARSAAVAKAFGSVEQMVAASEAEWTKIDGIGRVIAKQAVEALR